MKDWVRLYLLEKHTELLAELDYDESKKKISTEYKIKELEHEEAVYCDLADLFNTHFGIGGMGGPSYSFTVRFGSVLADLPQEAFVKLCGMKNLVFTFNANPGAEVKQFNFEHDIHIPAGEMLQVVVFPYENEFMYFGAARGEIVHELAHLYLEHTATIEHEKQEDETDNLAREWGFEKEIEALREYEKENWV